MKSVTSKITTLRRATAVGSVRASPGAIQRLRENDLPKKDVLVVARVAAIAAAKRTPDLIPYCHPLPIDAASVDFELAGDRIDITASVEAIYKTGAEMEALTAVSAAALTIYDMLKPVDSELEICSLRLQAKQGGKSDFKDRPPAGLRAAVLVTSNGVFAGTRPDRAGPVVRACLEDYGLRPQFEVVSDDLEQIEASLRKLVAAEVDLILTVGGTGLSRRDVTVEASRKLIQREIPGVAEAARAHGQARTPYAMLSRATAGLCGQSLIVNLPGSSKGAQESMDALFPGLFHAYPMLGYRDGPR